MGHKYFIAAYDFMSVGYQVRPQIDGGKEKDKLSFLEWRKDSGAMDQVSVQIK